MSGPPQERGARVERLRDATAAVPGVCSAAVSSVRLLTGGGTSTGMVAIGDGPMSRIRPTLWLNGTTPGWFATMGIPLRSGRDPELVFLRSFPGAHQIPQRLMCRVGYPHGG